MEKCLIYAITAWQIFSASLQERATFLIFHLTDAPLFIHLMARVYQKTICIDADFCLVFIFVRERALLNKIFWGQSFYSIKTG